MKLGSIRVRRVSSSGELDDTTLCLWRTDKCWVLYLPGCGIGELSNHQVVENVDGTVTVSPSILMRGHKDGEASEVHGHIISDVWNDC